MYRRHCTSNPMYRVVERRSLRSVRRKSTKSLLLFEKNKTREAKWRTDLPVGFTENPKNERRFLFSPACDETRKKFRVTRPGSVGRATSGFHVIRLRKRDFHCHRRRLLAHDGVALMTAKVGRWGNALCTVLKKRIKNGDEKKVKK